MQCKYSFKSYVSSFSLYDKCNRSCYLVLAQTHINPFYTPKGSYYVMAQAVRPSLSKFLWTELCPFFKYFHRAYNAPVGGALLFFFKHSTFVGSTWSFVFFIPATTANDLRLRMISILYLIHYFIFLSYFLRKSQYFPFQCWVLNNSIFITSLVWRDPSRIEPETSRTRCQHSTTRLSRRRKCSWFSL